jgi:hypothetical protein
MNNKLAELTKLIKNRWWWWVITFLCLLLVLLGGTIQKICDKYSVWWEVIKLSLVVVISIKGVLYVTSYL